ncbi:MAG TPA: YCF48-related protein [Pirellulales bacterium]|jgi:photosystem II stability/assembly factor-like uncharacterized protein|nr:YCF48-related protein [Pirellulales bacterium]
MASRCAAAAEGTAGSTGESASPTDAWRRDAQLNAVDFIDSQQGWAVGDRGAIWSTGDGGASWILQPTPVDCALNSVQFLDRHNGWAAGGFMQPYTHGSVGVLLRTTDGGAHWQLQPIKVLPQIHRLKFVDSHTGIAIGRASALFGGGVCITRNAGQDWAPLPGAEGQDWTTGDFSDEQHGALAGTQNVVAVNQQAWAKARQPETGRRRPLDLRLRNNGRGWLVGEGGLVLATVDGGALWQPPRTLPPGIERFDWHAVALQDEHVWIAGAPGSRILHSPDGGGTWEWEATGETLPWEAVRFVDATHGWAVGALGAIAATRDGGKTWKSQRAGGARVAALGLFARAEQIPLEFFAHAAAGEGYLARAEILTRRDPIDESAATQFVAERAHEALTQLGAAGADDDWKFPVRAPALRVPLEKTLQAWDDLHAGSGAAAFEDALVARIRTWRPETIVTTEADDPLTKFCNAAVRRAAERAAQPSPDDPTGLAPWQVKRIFARMPSGEQGITLAAAQITPRLARSLANLTAAPRGLLASEFAEQPLATSYRAVLDRSPAPSGGSDFFSWLNADSSREFLRPANELPRDQFDALRRAAQQRRHVQAILEHAAEDRDQAAAWIANVGELLRGLDEDSSAQLLFQFGQRLYRHGQWDLAAEVFRAQASSYAAHALTPAALTWLLEDACSSESARRDPPQAGEENRLVSGQTELRGSDLAPRRDGARPIDTSSEPTGGAGAKKMAPRLAQALAIVRDLERDAPTLPAEARYGFPVASLQRRFGAAAEARRFFQNAARSSRHDAWWNCAAGEIWIERASGACPKDLWVAARTQARPHLDAQLDEPCWRAAKPIRLTSQARDDEAWPAVAYAAYDDTFFYVAFQGRQAAGAQYPAAAGPRERDADLAARDHFDLLFDPDRSYVNFLRLSCDHQGRTADAAGADASWNPKWYVAAATKEGVWTVEAAIAWKELVSAAPAAGDIWGANIQRIVPGVGFQSWSAGAPEPQAERFGYLRFD